MSPTWKFFKKKEKDRKRDPAPNGPAIDFGDLGLDYPEGTTHFAWVSTTGGGKTSLMRLLMQSVLGPIGSGTGQRALIADPKEDMFPLVSAFCRRHAIKSLNPFDARGVAWDPSSDIREPRVAVEIAFTLIPREHESQPFFADAARHLVIGVLYSFLKSGVEWTLADLLRALMTPRRLKAILKRHPETRHLIDRYFYDRRLLSNILSTIASKTLAFEPIAAAWEAASEKISLTEWAQREVILILGHSEISRHAMDAINRCIFKRATDITLHQSETLSPRTWFFLDELSEIGRLDGLVSLLKRGRSKGACVGVAFQTISGLRDPRMYDRHFTDEIVGQIGNRFFGRIECPETAAWASSIFGDAEVDQFTTSTSSGSSSGGNSTSRTVNQQVVVKKTVLPSEFMTIPACTKENGLSGYFIVRSAGAYYTTIDGQKLFEQDLIPPAADVPAFIPRDIEAQFLKPWTKEQAKKFGAIGPRIDADRKRKRDKRNLPDLGDRDDTDDL